jgi:hypothetical protein
MLGERQPADSWNPATTGRRAPAAAPDSRAPRSVLRDEDHHVAGEHRGANSPQRRRRGVTQVTSCQVSAAPWRAFGSAGSRQSTVS